MPLTNTQIGNAKPDPKPVKMHDTGGLYLEIAPSSGKWWRLKYRIGGKKKRISLGVSRTFLSRRHATAATMRERYFQVA